MEEERTNCEVVGERFEEAKGEVRLHNAIERAPPFLIVKDDFTELLTIKVSSLLVENVLTEGGDELVEARGALDDDLASNLVEVDHSEAEALHEEDIKQKKNE